MADKEIKIRAVLDSSGFDQQIKQMQDRVTQITKQSGVMQTAQSQFGQGSGMSKLTQSFFGDFNKGSVNELREQFNLNVRNMQAQSRNMREKERELTKLSKLEQQMTESQKQRVKLLNDEVQAIKQKGRVLIEENNKIASTARGLGVDNLAQAGFKGTGTAPPAQQGFLGRMTGQASNILSQMGGGSVLAGAGMLAGRIGGVGLAGMNLAGDYIDYQRTRDRTMASNIGKSVQAGNIGFESIMQKRGFMNQFENPERQAALQMALSERERRLTLDPMRAFGSAATSAAGYGAAGAVAGSFLPVVGTGLGGIGGAVYGAGKSLMSGGARSGFAQMFDREAYEASIGTETLGNFRANLTAMKMANPEKFAAAEMFSQRRQGLQGRQRQLNMTDEEFLGGRLSRQEAGQAGLPAGSTFEGFLTRSTRDRGGRFSFGEERIGQNIDQILQAGGTSDFVTRQMGATMAAEYQRGGLTNAAKQLGGISATGNVSGAQTEEQYKKFIADAMRIGLDSSEFAKESTTANEEVRRTMEAISGVYTRSGGAEGAVDVFQAGLMGGAGAQIEGAQSAFNIRNQESGQGTGYRGALKYAFLNSEKGRKMFEGISSDVMNNLVSYNLENLDEDDILIQKAAQEQSKATGKKVSSSDIIGKVRKLQQSGENFGARTDQKKQQAEQAYSQFLSKNGLQDTAENRRKFRQSDEGIDVLGSAFAAAGVERMDQFVQQKAQSKDAYVFGGMGISKDFKNIDTTLSTRARGAMDTQEASTAADQATAIGVLNRHLDSLTKASEQNRDANQETRLNTQNASMALNELLTFIKEGGEDKSGELINMIQRFGGKNQPSMINKKNK